MQQDVIRKILDLEINQADVAIDKHPAGTTNAEITA